MVYEGQMVSSGVLFKEKNCYWLSISLDNTPVGICALERVYDVSKEYGLPKGSVLDSSDDIWEVLITSKSFKCLHKVDEGYKLARVQGQYVYVKPKEMQNKVIADFVRCHSYKQIVKFYLKWKWYLSYNTD